MASKVYQVNHNKQFSKKILHALYNSLGSNYKVVVVLTKVENSNNTNINRSSIDYIKDEKNYFIKLASLNVAIEKTLADNINDLNVIKRRKTDYVYTELENVNNANDKNLYDTLYINEKIKAAYTNEDYEDITLKFNTTTVLLVNNKNITDDIDLTEVNSDSSLEYNDITAANSIIIAQSRHEDIVLPKDDDVYSPTEEEQTFEIFIDI